MLNKLDQPPKIAKQIAQQQQNNNVENNTIKNVIVTEDPYPNPQQKEKSGGGHTFGPDMMSFLFLSISFSSAMGV